MKIAVVAVTIIKSPNIRPANLCAFVPLRRIRTYAPRKEDHFVRIHSAAGEQMLQMRLPDAENLAMSLIGLKPHRSWWVAETGVESVTRSGGKTSITIKSGAAFPSAAKAQSA